MDAKTQAALEILKPYIFEALESGMTFQIAFETACRRVNDTCREMIKGASVRSQKARKSILAAVATKYGVKLS